MGGALLELAVPFSLHLNPRTAEVASELQKALDATGDELAPAALAIARVEYPSLDPKPYVAMLDRMGEEAAKRLKEMLEFTETADRWFTQMLAVPRPQLAALMRLGARIVRFLPAGRGKRPSRTGSEGEHER